MNTEQAVERAEALSSLQRYEEARGLLARRLAEAPEDAVAWTELARCHYRLEQFDEAVAAVQEALRLAPEDVNTLLLHGHLQVRTGAGIDRAVATFREAVRVRPGSAAALATLADHLMRRVTIRSAQADGRFGPDGFRTVTDEELAAGSAEAVALADEAIRLAPEELYPYRIRRFIAGLSGDRETSEAMNRAILRIDPTDAGALSARSRRAAHTPGVRAAEAADLTADALAVAPQSASMRADLDAATYRLLRGTRWLGLFCLVFAAVGLDLWPGETPRELPLPLGQRLWDVLLLAAVWALGTLPRFRRRRRGVRLNLRSLLRRDGWARLALAQAATVTGCALLLALIPWTARDVPRTIFWIALATTLLTMWADRPAVRRAYRAGRTGAAKS
ncbi:tetratricopeptide repeat protein [Streptomyces sp. LP05-1]|uniref:Tetratricopeptide repeat protein n=1 Tax=Streptomyces pyxinae TaxID=2970734 RepID=A0ABT2CMB0_9ACTN|nr:tetratricopeptide repeat protein [Streptomyces sp. LP05-1]MCS0638573.1 tetratricopeptide repeat protein [Streptomyces sp. LP05-1]